MERVLALQEKRIKPTGLGLPWHYLQVISTLLLLAQLVVTAVPIAATLPPGMRRDFLMTSGFMQVMTLILGFMLLVSDPTDSAVYEHKKAFIEKVPFDTTKYPSLCTICRTGVHSNSKHCGHCNRCVEEFDHHCKWVNNCIGKDNYRLFISFLAVLFVSELSVAVFNIVFLTHSFGDRKGEFSQICEETLDWDCLVFAQVVMVLVALTAVPAAVAVGNLLAVQIWLRQIKKMTTYDYILQRKKTSNYKIVANQSVEVAVSEENQGLRHPAISYDGQSAAMASTSPQAVEAPSPRRNPQLRGEAYNHFRKLVARRLNSIRIPSQNLPLRT